MITLSFLYAEIFTIGLSFLNREKEKGDPTLRARKRVKITHPRALAGVRVRKKVTE